MTYKPLSDEDVAHARTALDDMDDFARMTTGVVASGAMKVLTDFIERAAVLARVSAPMPADQVTCDCGDVYTGFGAGFVAGRGMCQNCVTARGLTLDAPTPLPAPEGWKWVPLEPTPEMVVAYLRANDEYWRRTDDLPNPPDRWRTGTAATATAESYRAMLAAAPAVPLPVEPEPIDGEVQRIINGLSSSDPSHDYGAEAIALILRLVSDNTGPGEHATWKDAAIAERTLRIKAKDNPPATSPDTLAAIRQGIEALENEYSLHIGYDDSEPGPEELTDAIAALQAAERAIVGETP